MTEPKPPLPAQPNAPSDWTPAQLQHVETELLKEYPNLSRHIIHMAVILAQAAVAPSHGTVRLLAHTRRNLSAPAPGASGSPVDFGSGYQMPA